jgi:membrane protein implicated in regulation of membrane protease activity
MCCRRSGQVLYAFKAKNKRGTVERENEVPPYQVEIGAKLWRKEEQTLLLGQRGI